MLIYLHKINCIVVFVDFYLKYKKLVMIKRNLWICFKEKFISKIKRKSEMKTVCCIICGSIGCPRQQLFLSCQDSSGGFKTKYLHK